MIKSFRDKETDKIWKGDFSKKLPKEIQQRGRRKLRMLNNAHSVDDLKIPPSNRLEHLKGNLKNFYSIRINDQWRIIFQWSNNDAYEVQIRDYHK
jgi:toxin HigB-1